MREIRLDMPEEEIAVVREYDRTRKRIRKKRKMEENVRLNSSTIDTDEFDDFERDPESAALLAAETR